MEQDKRQSCFEVSLPGSTIVTDAKEEEPRPYKEAACDDDTQQALVHDAQVHFDNEPHPDTEAQYHEEPFCDIEAQYGHEFSREKDNRIHESVEPHLDEEAGPHRDNEAHYDKGWAWVVCGTTFLMEFFGGGLITSSGVIYAALIDEFDKSRAETG